MTLEAEEETSCGSPESVVAKQWNNLVPMDLLDEYWFFNNTLHSSSRRSSSSRVVVPQKPPPSPNKKSEELAFGSSIQHTNKDPLPPAPEKSPAGDSLAGRALLRAPSLPPLIGAGREEAAVEQEDEEVDVVWSSILLSAQITPNNNNVKPSLLRAPSMPSPQNSFSSFDGSCCPRHSISNTPKNELMRNASIGRHRMPRHMRKCCTNLHYCRLRNVGGDYKSAFQEKKWRSSSDLESIEVQGFKDLGFVFDEEVLDEGLASVIPGLREKKAQVDGGDGDGDGDDEDDDGGDSNVRRPYLSEAWHDQRLAPPTLKWADKRSATDVKEQLKFWARAVACDVRQECC